MTIISPYAIQQFFDDNGDPLAGGKLYTYEAGTTTPKETYTNSTGSSANTNPIILDSAGRASVWLGTGSYKFVLDDSADVNIDEVDNITGAAANVFGSSVESVSTNTNITTASENVLYQCTASLTLSLLAVASAGEGFIFGVTNTGSGSVTIDPDGAETIDGLSTIAVEAGQSLMIVCTGTAWLSIFLNTTNVTDQTSATITATDELMFGDVSDSSTNKKDTVQGVIDLVFADLEGSAAPVNDTLDLENDLVLYYDASASGLRKTDFHNFLTPNIVQTEKTDTFTSSTYDAWTDITGMSVSITPQLASSDVRIHVNMYASKAGASTTYYRILRGSTPISVGDAASSRIQATAAVYNATGNDNIHPVVIDIIDSPSTTSATTYKIQFYTDSNQDFYVNRTGADTDSTAYVRTVSTITVEEVFR